MSETLYELTFHSFVLLSICRRQTTELPFSFDGLKTQQQQQQQQNQQQQTNNLCASVYQKPFKCIRASLWCAHRSKVLLFAYRKQQNNNIKKKKKETKKRDKFTELFIVQ